MKVVVLWSPADLVQFRANSGSSVLGCFCSRMLLVCVCVCARAWAKRRHKETTCRLSLKSSRARSYLSYLWIAVNGKCIAGIKPQVRIQRILSVAFSHHRESFVVFYLCHNIVGLLEKAERSLEPTAKCVLLWPASGSAFGRITAETHKSKSRSIFLVI